MARGDRQRRAPALAGLALGLVMPWGALAEPLPRLAATLVTPGHAAALLESAAGQAWTVPGEFVGDCRLLQVDASSASLVCGAAERRVRLAAGAASPTHGDAAENLRPAMHSVRLPPAGLRAIMQNPQASALGIDLVPVSRAGDVIGWAVTRLDPGSPVSAAGLQPHDLVVAVDGAPAGQPEAFMAALRALPDADSFVLELLRAGRPTSLLVSVAEPVAP
ncbi:PDZ domain-containing protein [Wenzhouxiangella sp. XN24]|uniref:PDZ domain-containing protein n=1 Tax=Wenzhouxiangella sp. XN24 TaxID=2713569 RepID=UPI0013EA713F|nr:PDZ domain-containing protein [Wenzhouxiangella sp. XN24]NGX15668.1 hypothetical protein [Wenzhouxiangella sp. XN24]